MLKHVSSRKIIHIDMDAFYAAVEERDSPDIAGKPVIVGGLPSQRGVVATCNYVARQFGISSAVSSAKAVQLCPHAIFIKPRFQVYRQVSQEILSVFYDYTALVEPLSLDEGYLDVTDYTEENQCSATDLAKEIKARIKQRTRLTASAGVSYNKFLAKIASDINKPDGLFTITPSQGEAFVAQLPVARFHGVGKATMKRMHQLGIKYGRDLQRWSVQDLIAEFGKVGAYYHSAAFGIDDRPVVIDRVRKSIGSEKTFIQDLVDFSEMLSELKHSAREVAKTLVKKEMAGKTVTVKVKFSDFRQVTRSHTLPRPLGSLYELYELLPGLLEKSLTVGKPVRLLGVTVSGLCQSGAGRIPEQMDLLSEAKESECGSSQKEK